MRRLLALLVIPLLLVLAACGGGGGDDEGANGDGGGGSAAGLPTVEGAFGELPTVVVPEEEAPAELQSEVLIEGEGPPVEQGDLLVAHYLGQTWDPAEGGEVNVFDSSYERGLPATFPIGTGNVIPGWDETLVGVNAGSRVLMALPPEAGYGAEGNPDAGIGGEDTLVFVVDVIASYGADAAAEGEPTDETGAAGVTVEGGPGERPTLTIEEGAEPPTELTSTVLLEGSGEPVEEGALVVSQLELVSYDGQTMESTWETVGPQAATLGGQQMNLLTELVGVPVGSRVLVLVPAPEGEPTPSPSPSPSPSVEGTEPPPEDGEASPEPSPPPELPSFAVVVDVLHAASPAPGAP